VNGSIAAGFYIEQSKAEALGLQPGDQYALRAIDSEGNSSRPAYSEFEDTKWAKASVEEASRFTPGDQISVLQGQGGRKEFIAQATTDTRPPLVVRENIKFHTRKVSVKVAEQAKEILSHRSEIVGALKALNLESRWIEKPDLEKILSSSKLSEGALAAATELMQNFTEFGAILKSNGEYFHSDTVHFHQLKDLMHMHKSPQIILQMRGAMEPKARFEVQNMRTGNIFEIKAGSLGNFKYSVQNLEPGDTLIMKPTDHRGNKGKPIEIRYDPASEEGRGQTLNVMSLRFQKIP